MREATLGDAACTIPPGHRGGRVRGIDTRCVFLVLLGMPSHPTLSPDMGTFRIDVEIENPARPGDRRLVRSALVDSGAELSWFPRDLLESLGIAPVKVWHFRQADGTVLRRWTGGVVVHLAGLRTLDEVVLGEPGDLVLLGARSLEGLNLRIDPVTKRLVDAGPAPAAATGCAGRKALRTSGRGLAFRMQSNRIEPPEAIPGLRPEIGG